MWAIIGGSGFEKFDQFEVIEELGTSTPFGQASTGLKRVRLGNKEALFLSRHGTHHELLPSEVNYRANIFALKQNGAKGILSISAVGSLKKELKPGDAVVPNQYIDRTKSVRQTSFCGDGIVGHVSLAQPICTPAVKKAKDLWKDLDFDIHFEKTYVCIEGPYFSTHAESKSYIQMGADIIGMTNFPEFALAREAGIAYFPISFVTDYDCWDLNLPHVTLQEVLDVMRKNNAKAFKMTERVLAQISLEELNHGTHDMGLKTGLMTPLDQIAPKQREWLDILTN